MFLEHITVFATDQILLLATSNFFGGVIPPDNPIYNPSICGSGLIVIANLFIKITFLIAGLFSLWKFIEAGFVFIGSEGDPQTVAQAHDKITMTFVGLLVMVASFALAGIVGAVFFGSASALLNPSLTGVGSC